MNIIKIIPLEWFWIDSVILLNIGLLYVTWITTNSVTVHELEATNNTVRVNGIAKYLEILNIIYNNLVKISAAETNLFVSPIVIVLFMLELLHKGTKHVSVFSRFLIHSYKDRWPGSGTHDS